jgi:Flp pilus assembly CpaF family ATPase
MRALEATLEPAAIITATRVLATLDGQSLQPAAPFLNCILANGFRYHAALPPISDGPSVSIRAHARMLRLILEFMTATQAGYIQTAILSRSTILIAGGTNSGKTTLINTLINLISLSERRVIIEDAATGHSGGLSTIHANSCDQALTRLARLAQCDQQFIREAIDLVLFMERMPDGRRAVTEIKEISGKFAN